MSTTVGPGVSTRDTDKALSLYHLMDPEVLANPYPLYHRLRNEDPVHWDPFLHAWVVTRYADVIHVLHHFSANRTPSPELLSTIGLAALNPIAEVMVRQMLFLDPPNHTRLRALASAAFTVRRVEGLSSHVQAIMDDLLDAVLSNGRMDLIADFAGPAPAIVTAEMLGVPVADHKQLKEWSADFAEMLGNFQHNPDRIPRILRSVEDMSSYFRSAMREQRLHPRDGLISEMMAADVDGAKMNEDEIIANLIVTMVGGQETTTNLIGNGVLTLLRNPAAMERLRQDSSLIPSAVEELLRYESPSQHTARLAPEDVEIGGKHIRKRQAVIAVMGAANRDPERFPEPDRLDIDRKDNRHVAFGWAAHFCFGAHLARLEGQIALATILRRLPNLALDTAMPLTWRHNLGLRGLTALPVLFGKPDRGVTAAPRVSRTDEAHSPYSEARRNLMEKCLHGQLRLRPATQAIPHRDPDEPVPLSYSQEQVWLHAQMVPDIPLYNEPITIHYSGDLDIAALDQSFNEILRRHEAWRTCFTVMEGELLQNVKGELSISLPVVDLRHLPENKRDSTAVSIATEDARRPLDLTKLPLFRAKLVRLGDRQYRLYLVLSHIIFDGVAIYRVFLPELAALYQSRVAGRPSPVPDLEIQYPDYSCWQRKSLRPDSLTEHISYWRRQLGPNLPVLNLPTDYLRPPVQTFRGSMYPFTLSSSLTDAVRSLSRNEGITLFQTLLAGFAAFLCRYSSQNDFPIGSVTAGRGRPETESLLGYFLNTVVLRINLSDDPPFRDLLRRVRNLTLEALDHDCVPFGLLIQELNAPRDLSRSPLFQVMFSLEPSMPDLDPSWHLTQMDVDTGATKYDLYLELDERREAILARFHYSTDLFDRTTIARMSEHWIRLLEAAIQSPDQSISTLPMLAEGERRRVLVEWNDTKRDYSKASVHELFEAQVERRPEAVALVWGEQQLSYGELNRRANQLAHELRCKGVGPEAVVGVCVERSPDLIVALLGVLKAGGAYVPLDPALPRERLLFMLRDAGAQVLLTQDHLHTKLSEAPARVVCLDSDAEAISKQPSENCRSGVGPENLAYVIYTSGSTGLPKGVEVPHRALSNFLASMQVRPGLTEEDTLLAVTTASFDIAALELYLPLIVGARVILVSRNTATDGRRLRESLATSGATCMQATPTTWRLLVNAGWEGNADLKVLCGGEALPRELANELAARASAVWNMYGPTETTVWSAMHPVTSETGPVFVGRPIANTELYVLDSELQPVPIGVPGDLYIGGDGLARGYRNQPELTAEKFVPHPFSRQAGSRLYNTGDLARYRADGNLELLGRRDHQVKIRGFRVELGEIEAALGEHPAVQATAVVVRDDGPGEQRLVAYAVLQPGSLARAEELHSFLKSKLPDYMLPARFEFLPSLPVSPSGKVDRRALPAPASGKQEGEAESSAPGTELEKKLAGIWADVLKLDRVSVHDNFFDLGGHSLLAVKLVAHVEKVLGRILPVISVFQAPTVSELAVLLSTPGSLEKVPGVFPIQPKGSQPPFFCMGAGSLFRPLALRLGLDQPFVGLGTVKSDLCDLPAPFRLEDIATALVRKLRRLQPRGPYFLGGWCADGVIAYEVAQQLSAQGEKVGLLVLLDAWNPARWKEYSRLERSRIRLRRRVGKNLTNLWGHGLRETLADYEWRRKFRSLRHRIWYSYYRFMLAAQGQIDDRFRKFSRVGYFTVREYIPKPYSGPTLLIQSGPDAQRVEDPGLGWSGLLVGKSEIQFIPGGHKGIFLEPNVELLANTLKRCL